MWRDGLIEALLSGKSLGDALDVLGVSRGAYQKARQSHRDWAARVDWARAEGRRPGGGGSGLPDAEGSLVPASFEGFVARFFPDRRPHLPHQLRLVQELQTLGPREVCLFLVWPEAGKSSTLEDYICRKLALDPDHRFRYVSEASNLSKRIVGTVKRRFTDASLYADFIGRFGPFYEKGQEKSGRPWTTEEITVARSSGTERDRSLVASSWTSAVYGSRIDTLVLDDLQSQRNFSQAAEIARQIRGTFFNRGLEMRTIIIGTRIGPGDVYDRFLDAGLVTKQVILPASGGMGADPGEPTIPQFWDRDIFHDGRACCSGFRECPRDGSKLSPREFMELIRHQSGEETWWASYQQNPKADEVTTFGAYVDRCLDHERVIAA